MPLFWPHTSDQPCEPPPATAVQLDEIICHQMRTRHSLSLREIPAVMLHDQRALQTHRHAMGGGLPATYGR